MTTARPIATTLPPVAATLAAAMLPLFWFMPLVTKDMVVFLEPWFDHIKATGPIAVFAQPFSNYSPAYLYLLAAVTPFHLWLSAATAIKLLSLAGTAALALAVRRLLIQLDAPQPNRAAALIFILPSVALNAGLFGQCDAMWSAACVMALTAAIDRRHRMMLVWCGLALGFKAQAMLIAPFFVALLINRRVPLWLWPIAPLAAAATMLPAWAAGWPASDLATIYFRQADTYEALSLNAPNIWAIVQALPWIGTLPMVGLAFAATIGTTAGYIARFSVEPLNDRALLSAALLCPLMVAGLLPHMHERYFFLADILAFVLALSVRDRASWRIAWFVQMGSSLGLLGYLSGVHGLAMMGGVAMMVATVQLARPLLFRAANDNPLLARAV